VGHDHTITPGFPFAVSDPDLDGEQPGQAIADSVGAVVLRRAEGRDRQFPRGRLIAKTAAIMARGNELASWYA
jgi:hypothetical protein